MKYRDENGIFHDLYLPPTGDTLPIGAEVDYDGEDVPYGWEEVEEPKDIYSTDEIKTNKVWIDGKDVYRTVYVKNNQAIQNQTTLPHGISNIDKVLPTTFGELWDASNNQSIHFTSTANDTGKDLGLRVDRTNISFSGNDNWGGSVNRIIYVVIEYTKTTDQGSGS